MKLLWDDLVCVCVCRCVFDQFLADLGGQLTLVVVVADPGAQLSM